MKKIVVTLWPNLSQQVVTDGLNGKFTMMVSLSEVEPTEEAYLTNRLSPDSLKREPNIFEILTKKAKGHPNGLWNLAVCYDCGIGTKQMPDLANAYYLMAWTQAQFDEGKLSIETEEKALNLLPFTPSYEAYYDAALKGCPIAAYQAGLCLLNGIGVKEDDLMAVAFFTSATSAGVADAAYALGNCLEHGYGLPMDKKKAASFYQKAADGGSAGGKCNLGILLYNEGQVEKGLQLIKEASDLGFSEASKILQSLNEEDSRNPTSSQALHLFEESMVDNSFFPFFSQEQIYCFMTHKDESQKPVTMSKAINYINEGRLFDLQCNDAGTHFAVKIHGSNNNIYDSEIWFSSNKSTITKYQCTCPSYLRWHSPCKHIVALLAALSKNHQIACARNNKQAHEESKVTKNALKQKSTSEKSPKSNSKQPKDSETNNETRTCKNISSKESIAQNEKLCVIFSTAPKTKAILQTVSYREIESSDLEFINKRLTPEELKQIPNVFEKLNENNLGHSGALWNLALCYDYGIGTDPSLTSARDFYMESYVQNEIDAGKCEQKLTHSKLDEPFEAPLKLKAFSDAAKLGYMAANYWSGICYSKGYGIVKNQKRANDYFLKASALGCGKASALLAKNYEKGIGVEKCQQSELRFGYLAYQQGCTNAKIKNYSTVVYCTHCGTLYKMEQKECPLCHEGNNAAGIPSEIKSAQLLPTKNELYSNQKQELNNELNELQSKMERADSIENKIENKLTMTMLILIPPIVLWAIYFIYLLFAINFSHLPDSSFVAYIFLSISIVYVLCILCIRFLLPMWLKSKITDYEYLINEIKCKLDNLEQLK